MKRTRFSESQIVAILKQGDVGIKVKDLCREHGISDATYYNWKAKYRGLEASDLKRLKETEGELSKLKRMYADLALENQALKDLIEKSSNADGETSVHPHYAREAWRLHRSWVYRAQVGSVGVLSSSS